MASDGPYLLLAAMWSESDESEALSLYLKDFPAPVPDGYNKGQVVSFLRDTADAVAFRHTLNRLHLAELNDRPSPL